MKYFFSVLLTGIIILLGIWHIAVPDTVIARLFSAALEERGLRANLIGIKKGFFLNIDARQLNIEKSGVTLVSIENIRGKIDPFSPFSFRISSFLSGDIGGGKMNARLDLLRGRNMLDLTVEKAEVEGLPLLESAGITGRGLFSGDLNTENNSGEFRFKIEKAEFKSASFGGVPFPLEMFSEAKGILTLKSNIIEVKSFSMEGAGIFARLTGNIDGNTLRMNLELMPDRSFKDKNPIFSMLGAYQASPGYYSIPISSNLHF